MSCVIRDRVTGRQEQPWWRSSVGWCCSSANDARSALSRTCCAPGQTRRRRVRCLFFFQAEDGIRDYKVTGVQTCALPIYELEEPVDWILGSGHHARTYIYRQPDGELYQLPLAWYAQTKSWGMAPGYEDRKSVV